MTMVAVTSKSFSKDDFLRAQTLARYPNARFNDEQMTFDDQTLIAFLAGAERAIIGLERVNETILSSLPELTVISKYGVGIDALDVDAMKRHGVSLGWTPGVNKRSVSELVVAQMIASMRFLYESNQDVKSGVWQVRKSHQLSSRVVGIIGLGHVGQDLATLLAAFGCRIIAHDIEDCAEFAKPRGITMVTLDELLTQSDIVSIHTPLNDSTRHLVDSSKLSLMKDEAILMNYARGGIVDQSSVTEALENGKIGAVIFDVFDQEPPMDRKLITQPRFFASGHIGGSSFEAIHAMGLAAIDGLDSFYLTH